MIKFIISRVTMTKTKECGYVDQFNGAHYKIWRDCYNHEFLATNRWGFRRKIK